MDPLDSGHTQETYYPRKDGLRVHVARSQTVTCLGGDVGVADQNMVCFAAVIAF